MKNHKPNAALATLVVLALTALWGILRLYVYLEFKLPLTFVLPLLVCVWTRRRWHLWFMATAFAIMVLVKILVILPMNQLSTPDDTFYMGGTLFNIIVGAVVVLAVMRLRENLEEHNAKITAQNAELEAQAEELSQQNEEIRSQAEELAEQNEEIEAQSEEVANQNEELVDSNQRLGNREEILAGLLRASRNQESVPKLLEDLCRRTLTTLGDPAEAVLILEKNTDGELLLQAREGAAVENLNCVLPLAGSLAELVLRENRTAYVPDLAQRPDLAVPFGVEGPVRSILSAPFSLEGRPAGVLMACGATVAHWSDEQFRVIEWVAAQCGLMVDTLRWQRALAQRTAEVEAANSSKDRFLAMLSHELRTPLTPVLAAAGELEADERLPQDVRDDVHMIRRNVRIQSRLIDDLLDLTRIGRGAIHVENQVLPLAWLLREAAEIVSADLDARGQKLVQKLDELDGAMVLGDGPRLQQVFWNLIKNAIKFSPANSVVEVHGIILPEKQSVRIEVRDRGVGIADEDVDRIFLPFEQAMTGRRHGSDQGLGLGLAIAKSIVEAHGGDIAVHSDGLGQGAVFTVEFPLALVDQPTTDLGEGGATPAGKKVVAEITSRILLVEDHEDTGKILSRVLKRSGYDVHHVGSAADGFTAFQQYEFHLVISDLGLPDESGIELMRRIGTVRPGVPAICLTGFGMEEDAQACHEAGFKEHLTKPVDISQLQAAIGRLLKRY